MKFFFDQNILQMDEEIVLHKDERQYIADTTRSPFRWICSLEVEFPEPVLYALGPLEQPGSSWANIPPSMRGCGTGLLLAPQKVLTAAHVITGLKRIGRNRKGQAVFKLISAKKVTVIPGRNEDHPVNPKPFGQFIGKRVRVHPGFRKLLESPKGVDLMTIKRALSRDIGQIVLAKSPRKHPGWWGRDKRYRVSPLTNAFRRRLPKGNIHLAGYPGDKGRVSCGSLYYATDRVVSANYRINGRRQNLLLYQADTFAGMSGSPVWVKESSGVCRLVGVHSSFWDYKNSNLKNLVKVNVGALIMRT